MTNINRCFCNTPGFVLALLGTGGSSVERSVSLNVSSCAVDRLELRLFLKERSARLKSLIDCTRNSFV